MATKQATVDYILDQIHHAGELLSRKMFGEYALYSDGKVVAFVCDDQLYMKPTNSGKNFLKDPQEAPPYPGAKMYFLIPPEQWDEPDFLSELVRLTASEVPLPKKKRKQ